MNVKGSKILVVEDELIIRTILDNFLGNDGYEVFLAEKCSEADEILAKESIDLILLDINLPEKTGYDFLTEIRAVARTADIPVIFLTGQDEMSEKVKAFELGAADFIVKPFQTKDVLLRVNTHLQLSMKKHKEVLAEQQSKLEQIKEAHNAMFVDDHSCPAAKFHVCSSFLNEAGGDFYDIFEVGENKHAYFIADISGHDIKTSFLTPILKTFLREFLRLSDDRLASLKSFNRALKESLPSSKFATAALLIVDRAEAKASYYNMGHLPLLYLPKSTEKEVFYLESSGDVLGIHDDFRCDRYELSLKEGDRVLMFTDGLIEDVKNGKVFVEGLRALPNLVNEYRSLEGKEFTEKIFKESHKIRGLEEDDIVLLSVEI